MENEEYYIEDNDLVNFLKDVLGDKITDGDIQRILDASDDGELSEEDFDNLVDEILARSKTENSSRKPEPIIPSEVINEKEYVYLSNSPDKCPVCGSSLLNENYCPVCNLKFSFE